MRKLKVLALTKLTDLATPSLTIDEAIYYVDKTIENGWSRNVLVHQIESGL